MGHPQRQGLAYCRKCSGCRKSNPFRAVCMRLQRQRQGQMALKESKAVHDIQQDEELCTIEYQDNDRNVDLISIRHFNFDKVKSVIELSTRQKRTQITYKIDTGSDYNLKLFKVLKIIFPKSTTAKLCATKIIHSY